MRNLLGASLLVFVVVSSSGCSFFGIGCGLAGRIFPEMCSQYSGDCCGSKTESGFYNCGSLQSPFSYTCGGSGHDSSDGLTTCGCTTSKSAVAFQQQSRAFAGFGLPPFTYEVALPYAGMTSTHQLVFDPVLHDYQPYAGVVTYSPGFVFNGFTALGPAGTAIGSYQVDWAADSTVDLALALRALTADTAYVDIDLDGQATLFDPTIQHQANVPSPGSHRFLLTLPGGGDKAPFIGQVFRQLRVHAILNAGIFTNPATPGSYDVSGTFTSIDPDTGDANDGTGFAPFTFNAPPAAVSIAPSPLELVDHFLCYKTKASKGLVCNATATVNGGGLCTTDAECGGVAGACAKNKWPKGVQLGLADEIGGMTERTTDVTKPVRLCAPAEADGHARHDVVTHLRGYQSKDAKGSAPRVVSAPLRIINELGTLAVQIKAPDSLYEPARTQLGSPAPVLGANTVDRYQCYKAKTLTKRCSGDPTRACKSNAICGADGPCLDKFPKGLQVTLVDQFTAGKRFDVVKPTRLCSPALANGDPIQSPDGDLMCFRIKPAAGEPKHVAQIGAVHTTSQLARERLDTVVEDEVCIPSLALAGAPN